MNKDKFLIKVNYKSGISHEFWVYEFSIKGGVYTWKSVDEKTGQSSWVLME